MLIGSINCMVTVSHVPSFILSINVMRLSHTGSSEHLATFNKVHLFILFKYDKNWFANAHATTKNHAAKL